MRIFLIILVGYFMSLAQAKIEYSYITAQSVASVNQWTQISPSPLESWSGLLSPKNYLNSMSALSDYGPIGPYGVLSGIGPLGMFRQEEDNRFQFVSQTFETMQLILQFIEFFPAINFLESWLEWSVQKNALSHLGPLGDLGPLNENYWKWVTEKGLFPVNTGFTQQTQALGLWAPLGVTGPLGPLGPMGALGPNGPHLLKQRGTGEYEVLNAHHRDRCVLDGQDPNICREYKVDWNGQGQIRNYELVEGYSESFAKNLKDNDTSFYVTGTILEGESSDEYTFKSQHHQYVTIHVTGLTASHTFPEALSLLGLSALQIGEAKFGFISSYTLPPSFIFPLAISENYTHENLFDNFDLKIQVTSKEGQISREILLDSNERVDWIQIEVPQGAKITTTVELHEKWETSMMGFKLGRPTRAFCGERICVPAYRLTVTGTGSWISTSPLKGPHIQKFSFQK